MRFLKRLGALFSGGSGPSEDVHALHYYVRCRRCGEIIKARVDLRNELSSEYGEGEAATGYHYRKVLIGRGRCFQSIEVTMALDSRRNVVSREISGGEYASEEEYTRAAEAGPGG